MHNPISARFESKTARDIKQFFHLLTGVGRVRESRVRVRVKVGVKVGVRVIVFTFIVVISIVLSSCGSASSCVGLMIATFNQGEG